MFQTISESTRNFNAQRQRVLGYLLKLKSAIDSDTHDLAEALTQRFCDSVVDYLSAGHFQIFERFVPADHQYAAIEATTRDLMRFNDRFGNGGRIELRELAAALEQAAYTIDTRMELEDDVLSSRKAPQAAGRVRSAAFAAA